MQALKALTGMVPLRPASCDLFVFLCWQEGEEEEEAETMDEAVCVQLLFMMSRCFSSFLGARRSKVLTPRLLWLRTLRLRSSPVRVVSSSHLFAVCLA